MERVDGHASDGLFFLTDPGGSGKVPTCLRVPATGFSFLVGGGGGGPGTLSKTFEGIWGPCSCQGFPIYPVPKGAGMEADI